MTPEESSQFAGSFETATTPTEAGTSHELILRHQDYLEALARQIAATIGSNTPLEELVAWGQVGLAEAAQSFDPTLGAAFTTFSYYRIRGSIFDGLRKASWVSPSARARVAREAGATMVLAETPPPSGDDPQASARALRDTIHRLAGVYLASQMSEEPDDPADLHEQPGHGVEKRELIRALTSAMESLDQGMQELIRMLYMEQRTMTECATIFGCNKSSITRRHAAAIDSLRRAMRVIPETINRTPPHRP